MNDKQEVCVVHIETRRFWDASQNSYLPVMYPIFGVYSTREKAEYAVWDYFANRFEGKYKVCFDDFDAEGNRLSYDLCFKREDKIYKGHALYCIDFSLETIDV